MASSPPARATGAATGPVRRFLKDTFTCAWPLCDGVVCVCERVRSRKAEAANHSKPPAAADRLHRPPCPPPHPLSSNGPAAHLRSVVVAFQLGVLSLLVAAARAQAQQAKPGAGSRGA